eukprot:405344-Rhodomonas_salina.1
MEAHIPIVRHPYPTTGLSTVVNTRGAVVMLKGKMQKQYSCPSHRKHRYSGCQSSLGIWMWWPCKAEINDPAACAPVEDGSAFCQGCRVLNLILSSGMCWLIQCALKIRHSLPLVFRTEMSRGMMHLAWQGSCVLIAPIFNSVAIDSDMKSWWGLQFGPLGRLQASASGGPFLFHSRLYPLSMMLSTKLLDVICLQASMLDARLPGCHGVRSSGARQSGEISPLSPQSKLHCLSSTSVVKGIDFLLLLKKCNQLACTSKVWKRCQAVSAPPLKKGVEWREQLSWNWSGKSTGFPNQEGLCTCAVP